MVYIQEMYAQASLLCHSGIGCTHTKIKMTCGIEVDRGLTET